MAYYKIALFKYYPIFHGNDQDSEFINLYFNVVNTETDDIIYEYCKKIKLNQGNHHDMLYKPIMSILSGIPEDELVLDDKIKMIHDIDHLLIFDGLIDNKNTPYLVESVQSKVNCKVSALCKSILKHKDTYDKDMDFKIKKNHSILIKGRDVKIKLTQLETASIKNKDGKEYARLMNINTVSKPEYRFIIPSSKTDIEEITDVIKSNMVNGGTITEVYANSYMRKKMKDDSDIKKLNK